MEVDSDVDPKDPSFCAFCGCGWAGVWRHADQFGTNGDREAAFDAAVDDGEDHIQEQTEEER
jgi:predicted metalloprotease